MTTDLPTFESPLRIHETALTRWDFAEISLPPPVRSLRSQLHAELEDIIDGLPGPLSAEARRLLRAYAGGRDFFRLFYPPTWSFLHWLPSLGSVDHAQVKRARRIQAAALFLHLWDDHLCDGQLAVDLLRLELRSRVRERLRESAKAAQGEANILDETWDEYLCSLHRPEAVADLDAYCERFRRQVAIWTIAPHILGLAAAGDAGASALCATIAHFCVAWRIIDDIQDVHLDARAKIRTAAYFALDGNDRALWERTEQDPNLPTTALVQAVSSSGALAKLLTRARAELHAAESHAAAAGWDPIAREIAQCRIGLGGN